MEVRLARPPPKSRHVPVAIYRDASANLDMKTLVWTRGEGMPLDQFASRLASRPARDRRRERTVTERASRYRGDEA
jgi:hypothetical protein